MKRSSINLSDIKERIISLKGQAINIQANRGRKRIQNYTGFIDNIYPSVFTIKVQDNVNQENLTYSYSDVLCGDVKIVSKN